MTNKKYTDYLAKEFSPYIYEQRSSLISWYAWSSETLEKAKRENKLLFISVGYAACTWCARMMKLCFTDNVAIAALLNSKFIPILVDKDEHPDVDQYYSKAIQLLSENSGWPLSCFALPNGMPFFGATYIKPDLFETIAEGLYESYVTDPTVAERIANELSGSISTMQLVEKKHKHSFLEKDIRLIIEPWKRKFDHVNGGTCRPPKFPLASGYEFLLEASYYFRDSELKNHLVLTLDKMATGGVNDPLNGGFFRYATDTAWLAPQLEKTTVDNFILISLYSIAYTKTHRPLYKKVAEETVAFVIRELQSEQGGYYTSLLSDGEKEEAYYKWSVRELKELLGDKDAELAIDYYGLHSCASPDEKMPLNTATPIEDVAKKHSLPVIEASERIRQLGRVMRRRRRENGCPAANETILLSTNALGISALINAYQAFYSEDYLYLALEAASYLKERLYSTHTGLLSHSVKGGEVTCEAFLDGYAFTIDAFINLFIATGDAEWLELSEQLMDTAISRFYDSSTGMFLFKSSASKSLLTQSIAISDGALPSAGAVMASNLSYLSTFLKHTRYKKIALQSLYNMYAQLAGAGPFAASWARLLLHYVFDQYTVVLVGARSHESGLANAMKGYRPDVTILCVHDLKSLPLLTDVPDKQVGENSTVAYVFRNGSFEFKTTLPEELQDYMARSEVVERIAP